jgi:hypothetical protein
VFDNYFTDSISTFPPIGILNIVDRLWEETYLGHMPIRRVLLALACVAFSAVAQGNGQNGTTLAGYKTLDICSVSNTLWRYSGVISVWNQGAIDTTGFAINDFIENKTGKNWLFAFYVPVAYSGQIPAGTTQQTALTFPYSVDSAPLAGTIRNTVNLTILNHSSYLGTPFGPSPKATFAGTILPCSSGGGGGCVFTQGYWGNKPNVIWPSPYNRNATFFLSGQTWQQVMDTPVDISQGYYQLAHQYIAALLNVANGGAEPSGIQQTIDLATAWFGANGPSACTGAGSCGVQKDWAATLDLYNNGLYPGGPSHCQ